MWLGVPPMLRATVAITNREIGLFAVSGPTTSVPAIRPEASPLVPEISSDRRGRPPADERHRSEDMRRF
jgi:hypothetical protein